MKLFLTFLIIAVLQLSSRAFAQQVTLDRNNITLTAAFQEIHKQTGYGFIYSDRLLLKMNRVSLHIKNESIEKAMEICLDGQPLNFQIDQKIVTITAKTPLRPDSVRVRASINAKVLDEANDPLIFATVRVYNTNNATVTNANGNFILSGVSANELLEITCVGYETQRLPVASISKVIILRSASSKLDEVLVIAYGQTTNRLSTGSIVTISAKDLAKTSSPNVIEALSGMVPGLSVVQTSSTPSGNFRLTLRGSNTLGTDPTSNLYAINSPLILLDGLPLSSGTSGLNEQGLLQNGLKAAGSGQSPLFSINPEDIESISVLKDADATSIYGSLGSNGVILITSKKPSPGKLKVRASVKQGISTENRKISLMSSQQYFSMRNEALTNDQVAPTMNNAYDLLSWDKNRFTDWQKQLFNSGPHTTAQFGFTGGTELISYRLNSSYYYNDEDAGIANPITRQYKDQRGTMDLSIFTQSKNRRFKMSFREVFAKIRMVLPLSSPEEAIFLAPNAPSLLDANGNLNWADWRVAQGFPISVLNIFKPYRSSTFDNNLNANISYRFFDGLELNLLGSYRTTDVNQSQIEQSSVTTDPLLATPELKTKFGKNNFKIWSAESNLKYSLNINASSFQFLAGIQYNRNLQQNSFIDASGWPAGSSQESLDGAFNTATTLNNEEIRTASAYGRLTYNYANKYIINLSARRDGSSNFGNDKKYGNFGSAGLAWIFSKEPWMNPATSGGIFSFGKLRGSYGTTGLAVSQPYTYLSTFQSVPINYQGQPVNTFIQPENPDVKWAQTRKFDAAVDLGFFEDQLLLSAEWYDNHMNDVITNNPVTSVTGFNNLIYNQPAVIVNSGVESSVSFRSKSKTKFKWSAGANIGINRNKLVSFPNLSNSVYSSYGFKLGQSINNAYFQPVGKIDPQTGLYSPAGQQAIYHATDPRFTGGVQSQLSYKGLEISVNFTFASQRGLSNIIPVVVPGAITKGISNQPLTVIPNHWQHPGDISELPKYSSYGIGASAPYTSEIYYKDASYVCLKNARLKYTVAQSLAKRLLLAGISATITGQNLFYVTKFKGKNPELPFDGQYMPPSIFDLGLDLNF